MANIQEQVEAVDRHFKALELRKKGLSYVDIAKELGYKSAQTAHAAVKSGLKKTLAEPANELRTLELNRLDEALKAIWAKVLEGDYKAIDRLILISKRRGELLGLDAPIKQQSHVLELTPTDLKGMSDEQIDRIANGEDPLLVLRGKRGADNGEAVQSAADPTT